MSLEPLHARFLEELGRRLPGWTFVASRRHFRRSLPGRQHLIHVAFINHVDDFDVTIDVSIDFLAGRKSVCVLGAELGNIEGTGQRRHSVDSEETAVAAALEASAHIEAVGLPFLERYTDAATALASLAAGGREADLLSPIRALHAQQIAALEGLRDLGGA